MAWFRKNRKEKRSRADYISNWLAGKDLDWYGPRVAGVVVNENTAYNLPVVWACIRNISEDIGSLPLHLYRRLPGGGRERAHDHPLYAILHDAPNEAMSAMTFREVLTGHMETWGDGFAYIEYKNDFRIKSLWPLRPDKMTIVREKGQVFYRYVMPNGEQRDINPINIFHVPNWGFDGFQGYSTITYGRDAIGLGLAEQMYQEKYFENGAAPEVVLIHPEQLNLEEQQNLRESWEDRHKGVEKAHLTAVLEEGIKLEKVGFSPEDSELISARKYQLEEIARMFRMPLTKIQHPEKATYSNTEQEDLSYGKDCLRPRSRRWEQAISLRLLSEKERSEYYAEFLFEDLLKADTETRGKFYQTMRYAGVMNADEIREKENMNPIPEGQGQEFWMPGNMQAMGGESPSPTPNTPTRSLPLEGESRNRLEIVKNRARIQKAWQPMFADAAGRVVQREVQDMQRAAKKVFKTGNEGDFRKFYEEYYQDFPGVVKKIMTPTFMSYSEQIQAAAAEEVNGFVGMGAGMTECVQTHIDLFSKFHANQSAAILRNTMATRDDMYDEEDYDLVMSELSTWEERRPNEVASWETVRTNGLVLKATAFYAGVKTLEWVAAGPQGYIPAPQCMELDFKQVEVGDECGGGSFWYDDRKYQETEKRLNFEPSWGVYTPPLYLGCQCQIRGVV